MTTAQRQPTKRPTTALYRQALEQLALGLNKETGGKYLGQENPISYVGAARAYAKGMRLARQDYDDLGGPPAKILLRHLGLALMRLVPCLREQRENEMASTIIHVCLNHALSTQAAYRMALAYRDKSFASAAWVWPKDPEILRAQDDPLKVARGIELVSWHQQGAYGRAMTRERA
ncbi:MAG: hypothetical protein AB7G80_08120 [Dongiaceae bacterium]